MLQVMLLSIAAHKLSGKNIWQAEHLYKTGILCPCMGSSGYARFCLIQLLLEQMEQLLPGIFCCQNISGLLDSLSKPAREAQLDKWVYNAISIYLPEDFAAMASV